MSAPLWTAGNVFYLDYIIVIGWIALIAVPFNKLSKYFVLTPAFLLSVIYTFILYQQLPTLSSFNFLHLSRWSTMLKNPFLLVSTLTHLRIIDLYLAQWMVNDFYTYYTFAYSIVMDANGTYQMKKSWTFGRVLFTLILLLTYLTAPFGFLVYHLAKFTFLTKYKSHELIDYQNPQSFTPKSNLNQSQLQMQALHRRYVRFGDQLPQPLQKLYYFVQALLGLTVLFTIVLPAYFALRIYCRMVYHSKVNSQSKPHRFVPEYVRNVTAQMKLTSLSTPLNKRNLLWHLKFRLLQVSTIIEYVPNLKSPVNLFQAVQDYFTQIHHVDYSVFGDGIAVNSYELVKRYLQDLPPRKGFESLGWHTSSSQATFADLTTIFLSSDDPRMKLSRQIVFAWLHAFPYDFHEKKPQTESYLSRLVPRQISDKPNQNTVYQSVGEVMFFLATGGELRKHEREAFLDCVKTPFIFFPEWFNFLLAGHYPERKTLNCYYTLLQAFARYTDGPALQAALRAANDQTSEIEVLRLIAIVFSIAGSAAPAKLAYTVIDRLWSAPKTNVPLFKKNPQNFIKECARLDKVVPLVNVFTTEQISKEIEEHFRQHNENLTIPPNTPMHCSPVTANRDKKIFRDPDEFNPEREDLNNLFVWNGVEKDILEKDHSKRPVRYCPGHDLSLDVIQYVAQQFLPLVDEKIHDIDEPADTVLIKSTDSWTNGHMHENDAKSTSLPKCYSDTEQKLIRMNFNIPKPLEKDRSCYDVLDNYTKLMIKLMSSAIAESNGMPSRGSDILQPFSFPTKDLNMTRLDMAKFIPTWDEDDPKGSNFSRRFARWLVNQDIWDFQDYLTEFNSLEQALQWRATMFAALPLPNVVYTDMSSDAVMTQLAFAGCACHYTRRVDKSRYPECVIPDEQFLADAVYVNDMTALSAFRVRKPFERYGAAVYFDRDCHIIAVYWSHASRLVRKGEALWNHVKYAWRSSFFAYITIRDHLIATHLIESNAFVSAARKHLPVTHPLRKFTKPFTYHTVSVNYQAATSLVNERGLVHRIWAFDYDEFLKVSDYISMNYKFHLLAEYVPPSMSPKENQMPEDEWDKIYPIYHDHRKFSEIIRKYVENFFRINYQFHGQIDGNDKLPEDSHLTEFIAEICQQLGIAGITSIQYLIEVLSQLIAAGTGVHEHVGQISDYMLDPRFIGAKLQEGKEIQNIQTYSQILVLAVITGLRMPGLLEDWSHLIDQDEYYQENLRNYRDFKRELQELSKEIDRRNKIRNYPFESFNPKYMECSTSV